MSKKALITLKQFFLAGKTPSEEQFHDTLDSFVHKDDGVVDGIYVNERINEALENFTPPAYPVDLPADFFISTTPHSNYLTYKTDVYRQFKLPQFKDFEILNTNEIVRDPDQPNNLILTGNWGDETTPAIAVVLQGCKLQDNILTVEKISGAILPIAMSHSLNMFNGFAFAASRYSDVSTYGQKIIKFNPYNLSDITELTLPVTSPYTGTVTNLIIFEQYIYLLLTANTAADDFICRVDLNLKKCDVVFKRPDNSTTSRTNSYPITIHNNEIYVPTITNTASGYNVMGISVYTMAGELKRHREGLVIASDRSNLPGPYWMTIYNGKILVTSTRSSSSQPFLARIDCGYDTKNESIFVEEYYTMPNGLTDDHSIDSKGYIYINQISSDPINFPASLVKYNYLNFKDNIVEIDYYNDGHGSYGSLNYIPKASGLITKLSDLQNDLIINSSGTNISFTTSKIYNSPTTPANGNITNNLAGAIPGMMQKIYHLAASAPTLPSNWILTGTIQYQPNVLNIIYAEWVEGSRVEYWIKR